MSKKLIWISILLWLFICIELAIATQDHWLSIFLYAGGIVFFIIFIEYRKRQLEQKTKSKKRMPPSSYNTMPHYFPTEQVDIVRKMKSKKRRRKK